MADGKLGASADWRKSPPAPRSAQVHNQHDPKKEPESEPASRTPPRAPTHRAVQGTSARVRTSSVMRARKASTAITSCFFPAPRTRSARLSLSASRWQVFRMLQLPNAMPYIFAGLEIAMIFALIGAIVAEFVGAEKGLGMLIQSMNFTMDVAGQFSVLLLLSFVLCVYFCLLFLWIKNLKYIFFICIDHD